MRDLKFIYCTGIITALMLALFSPVDILAAPRADGTSLLSRGKWIKVHIDTTSVYRITHSQLREWGFDNPDRIIVAGYGSVERAHTLDTAPDDLPVLPVLHAPDAIYFYGEGDTRLTLNYAPSSGTTAPFTAHYNRYSTGSYYYIGESSGISSPEITTIKADSEQTSYVDTHYVMAHTRYHESHPHIHGLMSHSRVITKDSPRSIDFDVKGNNGSAALYYSYVWKHAESDYQSIGLSFSGEVTSANTSADHLSRNNSNEHTVFSYKQGRSILSLTGGAERFTATFSDSNDKFITLALANTTLIYQRDNRISAPQQTLHLPHSSEALRLTDAPQGLTVWDVSTPRRPVNLATVRNGNVTTTARPEAEETTVCAFTPSASIPSPAYAGTVPNQDISSLDGIDMLIVTTEATHSAALRLAAAHEQWQGMKTAVLRQSDIFNEYSSGALHPNGLRHLVMRLAASTTRPLRYLLLFGQGSWDTRIEFGKPDGEYMVTYNTEDPAEMGNITKQYSSDLYFGTLNSRISPSLSSMRQNATVSVGRIPAFDAASAEAYADKCITYLSDPFKAGSYSNEMIASCTGDSNAHLNASEYLGSLTTAAIGHPTLFRAHLSLFPLTITSTNFSESLARYVKTRFGGDVRLFNYLGHGGINTVMYQALNISREQEIIYGSLPVVYLSACSCVPVDISDQSLGKAMALHNPGPIAVIGAGTDVYLNYNIRLHNSFVELFYSPEGGECLGDVFRTAVNSVKSSTDQFTNNLCYNFLGDPALPRYTPARVASVTAIGNNSGLTSDSKVSVSPLSKTTISGVITDSEGNTDTSFSGRLLLNIYDAPHAQSTFKHDKTDAIVSLDIDEDIIHSSMINVESGRWSTDVTLPASSITGTNRMTLYAVSDSHVIASGGNRIITLSSDIPEGPSTGTDTTAPVIRLWLDSPDMADGAEVSSSPTLYIEITDDGSGVSLNSSAIGMMPKVMIDGTAVPAAASLLRPDGDERVSGEYRFSGLTDGHHTITVTARDIAGNSASRSIDFTVVHRDPTASLSASSSLVRDDVTLTLTHSLSTEIRSLRLVIRDIDGRTVLSTDSATFPFTWDFNDNYGQPVPDGVYRASVSINAYPYYTSTPETRFTIIKR